MRGEIHFLSTFSLPHPRLEILFTGYDIAVSIGDSFQYAVKKPSLALHEQESVSEFEQGVELLSFDSPYNLYILKVFCFIVYHFKKLLLTLPCYR